MLKTANNSQAANDGSTEDENDKRENCLNIPVQLVVDVGQVNCLIQDSSITLAASRCIGSLVEFRVRQVIQEALKLQRHSCSRSSGDPLLPADINNALGVLKMKQVWGFGGGEKDADRRGSSQVPSSPFARGHKSSPFARMPPRSYHQQKTMGNALSVNTTEFIDAPFTNSGDTSLPFVSVSWLAVEGCEVRPVDIGSQEFSGVDDVRCDPNNSTALYRLDRRSQRQAESVSRRSDDDCYGDGCKPPILEDVVQAELVEHELSKEHNMFLSQIKLALRHVIDGQVTSKTEEAAANVLTILKNDTSSAQLVPYLIHFGAAQIYKLIELKSSKSLYGLKLFINYFSSLISNSALRLFNYAHQIINPLLCIVLDKDLCAADDSADNQLTTLHLMSSSSTAEVCELRRLAAKVVAELAFKAAVQFPSIILIKLTNLYRRCLYNLTSPITTIIGAIIGIRALGCYAVRLVLFPVVPLLLSAAEIGEEYEMTISLNRIQRSQKRLESRTMLLNELTKAIQEGLESDDVEVMSSDSTMLSTINGKSDLIKSLFQHSETDNERLLSWICSATQKLSDNTHRKMNSVSCDLPEINRSDIPVAHSHIESSINKRSAEVQRIICNAKKVKTCSLHGLKLSDDTYDTATSDTGNDTGNDTCDKQTSSVGVDGLMLQV